MSKIVKDTSGVSLMVECEGCKARFQISTGDAVGHLQHKKEYRVNGRQIFLTFYDCPSCGRRHYVQIDDSRTLEMLKTNSRQFVKLSTKRKNDKPIPEKQLDKYKKTVKHLRDCRIALMKEFTGVILHDDETGEDFELRFSV